MAGSERKRLPLHSNSIRLFGKELQMYPTPPSPADPIATSMEVVGDQPIPALSAVSGLEDNNVLPRSRIPDLRRRPKYKVPPGFFLLFGKLYPKPKTPPPPPTDTTATSTGLVADQPASAVNGLQDTDNPPHSPGLGPEPNALGRPGRNGTALDPDSVGSWLREEARLWESNLWYPGVRIPGRRKKGFQMSLGSYLTEQEAQDVHDRAALKLFQTNGVVPVLNFHESRHTEFMEQYRDWNFRDFVWQLRRCSARFTAGKSSMKGVTVRGKMFKAKAAKTQGVEKVQYYFGKFESEEEAGRAYDRGLLFLHHEKTEGQKFKVITNFRPSGYSESEILRAGRESQQYKDSESSRIA